jgi:hypothetical protein
MQYVFISYKNEDLDFAENVINRLEKAGQFRFEDRDISAAPSRLEIRRLVITELKPPQNVLPDGTGSFAW